MLSTNANLPFELLNPIIRYCIISNVHNSISRTCKYASDATKIIYMDLMEYVNIDKYYKLRAPDHVLLQIMFKIILSSLLILV